MALLDLPPSRYEVAHAVITRASEQQAEFVSGVVKALLSPYRKR